jgi:hypothetical protein
MTMSTSQSDGAYRGDEPAVLHECAQRLQQAARRLRGTLDAFEGVPDAERFDGKTAGVVGSDWAQSRVGIGQAINS